MALNPVPQSGQTLGQTRVPIFGNFTTINAAFLVDHVEYNTTGQGKHNKVTFPAQSPAPTFLSGEEGLYNLLNGTTSKNELYVHKQTSAGTADIPFTASVLSNSIPTNNSNGWTYLPSGILVKWMINLPVPNVGSNPVNLVAIGPTFTNVYWVGISTAGSNPSRTYSLVSIPSTTQIIIAASIAGGSVNVLVIGKGI